MPQKRQMPIVLILILLLVLIILIAILSGKEHRAQEPTDSGVAQGIAYLESLESRDPTVVEDILKEYRHQEILAQREARLAELENGTVSVWSLFTDYVLLGDSRAVGFDFYEYLSSDRVIAESGATILHLESHIPDIVEKNPSYLFLCYGLNDVSIGIWNTPEDYTTEFRRILSDIQTQLPDVKIFISSILPARDPAFNTSSAWYNIPEYSAAVQEMCDDVGCYYVDNTDICEKYADLWEVDGIHVQSSFYPHWAANMIMEVYDSETDETEDMLS